MCYYDRNLKCISNGYIGYQLQYKRCVEFIIKMSLLLCGTSSILRRVTSLASSVRHGYIVLVPEIGEDVSAENPLLKQNGLFQFEDFSSDQCMSVIGKQTLDFEAGIRGIENQIVENKTSDVVKDFFEPLEILSSTLDRTWGLAKCLYLGNNSMMPVSYYSALHNRAQRARAAKYNSKPIFDLVQNSLEQPNLSEEHTRILKKFELEGKLNGLQLNKSHKTELGVCLNKLSKEKNEFRTKVKKATSAYELAIPMANIIEPFPEELQKSIFTYENGSWLFKLQSHLYMPFMEHCAIRELRYDVWRAMVSRCCPSKNKTESTSINLEEIRCLRKYQANLLGYKTFADMSMETKMAGSVKNVKNTFESLARECKVSAELEMRSLGKFAKKKGCRDQLELWDVPYWRKRAREEKLAYNEDSFRNYFPLPKVLEGMFCLCEKLFKVKIQTRDGVSMWDDSMKFFDVFEENSGEPVASFYLDPYVRSRNKYADHSNTAWMVGMQNRSEIVSTKPLASLIFNFPMPTENKPSLLSFEEVTLLFNKFGHCLQHLLTKANYSEVSGVSNIEWDAVEVCGHVFSYFLYNQAVMDSVSCHYENGEKLPTHMFKILHEVKDHMQGYDLSEELYLSLLDLELHSTDIFWLDLVKELWPQYRFLPLYKVDSHPCSFVQIFADEWAASHYSHLWARMVAADVYTAFEEAEKNHKEIEVVGKRFKDTYLALGGSCHPREVFRKFRGRDPSSMAFLKFINFTVSETYVASAM